MNYSNAADGKKDSINSENVSKQLNSVWVSVKVQACLCDRA
jgi:hypothetical protein